MFFLLKHFTPFFFYTITIDELFAFLCSSMVNAGITSIARKAFPLPSLQELILDGNDFSGGLDRFLFYDLRVLELL